MVNVEEWQSSIKWRRTAPLLSITWRGILMILGTERTLMSLVPMEEIALPEEDIQGKVPLEVDIQGEEVPEGWMTRRRPSQEGPSKGRPSR